MQGSDRVFILTPEEGENPKNSSGMIDKRLFTGDNKLHAIRDEASSFLWYFKFDHGILPQYLNGRRYTKFDEAKKDLERYFNSRNVEIKEVID
jgi:hypothetical protein